MNTAASAKKFEQQLNSTLGDLRYTFKNLNTMSVLQIAEFPEILFPHGAGGSVFGGASTWVRQKHRNGGIHEPAMIAALLALRQRADSAAPVFFDIGALFGYFSLVVNSLFANVSVCAFEMNPDSFGALGNNLAENQRTPQGNLRCFNVGLSDRTELQHNSRIDRFRLYEEPAGEEGVALDIMRLDDFCRDHDVWPTIMKIDVEGYQAKIIPGAMATIAACAPVILLEFDKPAIMQRFGTTNKALVEPLFDLGYSLFWCSEQRIRASRFDQLQFEDLSAAHEQNSLALFIRI